MSTSTFIPPAQVVRRRYLGAFGAVLAALSLALAAYAEHAGTPATQSHLMLAAAFGFGHGLALAALAPLAQRPTALLALASMLLGVLLFSGSLALSALMGLPTVLVPFGGALMMGGWLLLALDRLRG